MTPEYYEERKTVRPILFVRNLIVYPGQVVHFDIEDEFSENVVNWAIKEEEQLLVLMLKDVNIEKPSLEDYAEIGTVISIKQSFNMAQGQTKVLVEGLGRARLERIVQEKPVFEGEVTDLVYQIGQVSDTERIQLLKRLVVDTAVQHLTQNTQLPEVFLLPLYEIVDPSRLADEVASHLNLRPSEAQAVIEELDVEKRLEKLQIQLNYMSGMFDLQKEISEEAMGRMNHSQKEYMLREQMSIIKEELGEDSQDLSDLQEEYREAVEDLDMPDESKDLVMKEVDRLGFLSPMSPEVNVTRSYLDTVIELPWGIYTEDNLDLDHASKILDQNHYGLKEVKERIIEFIAVRNLRQDPKGSILCLIGPPGVGKTSIAKAIAQALNREFTSMRLGGVTDESEIRGHRRTYVGAMPGRIISQMNQADSMNPVFLFDEVDKIGTDFRGDPASALLEVLDPEQNRAFHDRYLEIDFDLSQVMFIATANTSETIPDALLDRMEVIEVPGYTENEKFHIAKNFLVEKQREEAGLTKEQFSITDGAIREVIDLYTREAGVRELERQVGSLARKTAKQIVLGKDQIRIKKSDVEDFLGKAKYDHDRVNKNAEIGVVRGLAWTRFGGEILHIEANVMPGHGGIQLTGSLGDVMKESAITAVSYLRSNAKRFDIDEGFYARNDIHIHLPEGAVKKDGPSAGVSLVTAIVSALTNRPVRTDIAMTGEITLTGKVLPIGGVKEKVLAAKRYKINTVLLPKDNEKDIDELEEEIKKDMNFVPLETIDELLEYSLLEPVEEKSPIIFESSKESKNMGFNLGRTQL